MHIPKAMRITLRTILNIPNELFDELEKIDLVEIQAGLIATVKHVQAELPAVIARQDRIERSLIMILNNQERIMTAIDNVAETLHIAEGGLPSSLPVSGQDWEGKAEVEALLLTQTMELKTDE